MNFDKVLFFKDLAILPNPYRRNSTGHMGIHYDCGGKKRNSACIKSHLLIYIVWQ